MILEVIPRDFKAFPRAGTRFPGRSAEKQFPEPTKPDLGRRRAEGALDLRDRGTGWSDEHRPQVDQEADRHTDTHIHIITDGHL